MHHRSTAGQHAFITQYCPFCVCSDFSFHDPTYHDLQNLHKIQALPCTELPVLTRTITSNYQDPADLVWLEAAAQLGISVERSAKAYASWDGKGTLTLASEEHLDPDDCLAQMIFHEICHLLVSGETAFALVDWGLDNTSPKDLVYENATNRLQAALSGAYGLRRFMRVTTMWRSYYDALPPDPMTPAADPAVVLASAGLEAARKSPYRQVLHEALSATAVIADSIGSLAPESSLWSLALAMHPTGFTLHADQTKQCSSCAWAIPGKEHDMRCRLTRPGCRPVDYSLAEHPVPPRTVKLHSTQVACEHHEPVLEPADCAACGACCHRGFDVVEVSQREKFARLYPTLIELRSETRSVVPRPAGRCVALTGDGSNTAPFRCRHYEDRPRSCRNFALGGDACLIARARCGIYKADA